MKVAILGNGGFGTAMALSLVRGGHAVALWGHDAVYTAHIAASRTQPFSPAASSIRAKRG